MGLTLSFKDIIIRLLLATIVGGVIGYEREYHNRAAGFRTQILVCVGAAIVSLIEIRLGQDVFEAIKDNYYIRSVIKLIMLDWELRSFRGLVMRKFWMVSYRAKLVLVRF